MIIDLFYPVSYMRYIYTMFESRQVFAGIVGGTLTDAKPVNNWR